MTWSTTLREPPNSRTQAMEEYENELSHVPTHKEASARGNTPI